MPYLLLATATDMGDHQQQKLMLHQQKIPEKRPHSAGLYSWAINQNYTNRDGTIIRGRFCLWGVCGV